MSDARRLKDALGKISSQESFSTQAGMIGTIAQSVNDFIREINEEQRLVSQISDYEKKLQTPPKDRDEEAEHRDIEDLLQRAKSLESSMRQKREALRRLDRVVDGLKKNIARALD